MKTLAITTLLTAAFLVAGCNSKQAEDTAAMRAMMEKQQANVELQKQREADFKKAQREALKATNKP